MPVLEPIDGSALDLEYPQDEFFVRRFEIYQPERPLFNGDPGGTIFEVVHTNWPGHWKTAKGLDQPELGGRQDQDLVFTTEILAFPIVTNIDQDYWVRDVTTTRRGNSRNFGRYFAVRGNPSFNEPDIHMNLDPDIAIPWLTVNCSVEASPPPGLQPPVADITPML